jgi:hypothetical protein
MPWLPKVQVQMADVFDDWQQERQTRTPPNEQRCDGQPNPPEIKRNSALLTRPTGSDHQESFPPDIAFSGLAYTGFEAFHSKDEQTLSINEPP